MEGTTGIEPASSAWKAEVLATIRRSRAVTCGDLLRCPGGGARYVTGPWGPDRFTTIHHRVPADETPGPGPGGGPDRAPARAPGRVPRAAGPPVPRRPPSARAPVAAASTSAVVDASTSAVASAAAAASTSTVTTVFMSRPRAVHRLLTVASPPGHRDATAGSPGCPTLPGP